MQVPSSFVMHHPEANRRPSLSFLKSISRERFAGRGGPPFPWLVCVLVFDSQGEASPPPVPSTLLPSHQHSSSPTLHQSTPHEHFSPFLSSLSLLSPLLSPPSLLPSPLSSPLTNTTPSPSPFSSPLSRRSLPSPSPAKALWDVCLGCANSSGKNLRERRV